MYCLTIHEPYASLIAVGVKTIETRGWSTRYRGPLLIHASKAWGPEMEADARRCGQLMTTCSISERLMTPEQRQIGLLPWSEKVGRVLCVAQLVDCRPMLEAPDDVNALFGHFGPGRFGWVLEDAIPLNPPVPWRGAQGLWGVPDKLYGWVRGAMTRECKKLVI